jgi:SAM-dependent methyltransferase
MAQFYAREESRQLYQKMLNSNEDRAVRPGSPADCLLIELLSSGVDSILEVGCASGWLYRQLRTRGFVGRYLGLEMADYLTSHNRTRHPDAQWETGTVYNLPLANESIDACVAFYVVEHTIYPQNALVEMLRVLKPGGRCLLFFPDFHAIGFFPSQLTGFTPGNAREKLRTGRWLDAAVTLYDSRLRVRPAIRYASQRFGPFPINTAPLCLEYPDLMWADIDAVYLSSKVEIAEWARGQNLRVNFPAGVTGEFAFHAFIAITKSAP